MSGTTSDQYISEIRIFAGTYAPVGWLLCDGKEYDISNYQQLHSLIGTTYGGDGRTTFKVPNLKDEHRVPIHTDGTTNYRIGQPGGEETVKLTENQLPAHRHALLGAYSRGGGTNNPVNAAFGLSDDADIYQTTTDSSLQQMSPKMLSSVGEGQPHNNMSPYLAINYIIAYQGDYPQQG